MNTPQITAGDNGNGAGPAAIPPYPVTPVFPAPVTPGQVVSSTTYGNVVRQALIDLWTNVQHVGTAAGAGVPESRQVIAGAGLTGGGSLAADVTLTANVRTVFGRTGDVVLTGADITAAGGVAASRQVIAGAGLTGGGSLAADVTLAVVDNTSIQKITALVNGAAIGTRSKVNLIAGASVVITGADNAAGDRIDITINSTGGGSGGGSQTPWLSDIDAAGFKLNRVGGILTNRAGVSAWDSNAFLFQIDGTTYAKIGIENTLNLRISTGVVVDGNVGIGTTTPSERLTLPLGANIMLDTFANSGAGGTGIFFRGGFSPNGASSDAASLRNMSIRSRQGASFPTLSGAIEINGYDGLYFGTNATDRMVITNGGNVGIGGTPNARLDVVYPSTDPSHVTGGSVAPFSVRDAASANANGLFMGMHITATPYAWIQAVQPGIVVRPLTLQPSGGNVGIGTGSTPPQSTLHVYGTSDHTVIRVEGTTGYPRLELKSDSRLYQFACGGSAAGSLAGSFYIFDENTGATRFVINSSGNVGIGTAAPASRLHVELAAEDDVRVQAAGSTQLRLIGYNSQALGPSIQALNAAASSYVPLMIISQGLELLPGNVTIWSSFIKIEGLPSSNPGAGSKRLWYDPAAGNVVKFAA